MKADSQYRLAGSAERTGVYIPRDELEAKLLEINETWAVVRLGNKLRYLHESVEGETELYDKQSLNNWFANWFYFWRDKSGREHSALIISVWLKWQFRRQYRGFQFCPEPEGAPEGVFNSYYGFSVEPKPALGSACSRIFTATSADGTRITSASSSRGSLSSCSSRTSNPEPTSF